MLVRIFGYEKIKVKKRCKHPDPLVCDLSPDCEEMFVYCQRCGLRTKNVPFKNGADGAWARAIFLEAKEKGELYIDTEHLWKIYSRDVDTNKITPSLCYRDEWG